ncbi:MAG: GMC family oxidoreductase N-terminal domain-containing protein, partial [Geminicoccaceae bacterium]
MAARDDVADVLIIGSGATGSIAAKVLGEAGLRVVCLEQGGWVEPEDHPHYSPDWQWQRRSRWSADVNVRQGNADDFPVRSNSSQVLMWNGVGGSTNVYGALWPRYRPSDFRKGTEHGLQPDWPISYEDLSTYYDRADRLVGVSGLAGDLAMPPSDDYPTPPLPMQAASRRLAKAFDRLDWHWWPVPAGVISRNYDGRLACHGCGICTGCPRGSMSKYSTSVWPKALEAGVELRTYARVIRIEKDRTGRATGAVYVDRTTGREHFQAAEVVILAANGVGTPRLLLASDNLANSSDQVGRNLLHHTLVACEMWVDEPLAAHTGYVAALISRQFAETDLSRGFVNGFNFNCVTTGGAGEQAMGFLSDAHAPWGAGHHQWFQRHFGRGFGVFAIGDDLPHPDNRNTLSDTERDADGVPVAKL